MNVKWFFETLQRNWSFYNLQRSVLVGKEDVPRGMETRSREDPR